MIKKVVVIRFSHRTQCLITTSVDITFFNLTTEYYVQKQLFTKSMSHSNLPTDILLLFLLLLLLLLLLLFLIKRIFSSIWLIWKVVAIRFFHRKQCLIVTTFDIVPSASLHLNHFFLFVSQYQKGDFVTKHEQFIQSTNSFFIIIVIIIIFNQSHTAINLLTCLPW